MNCANFVCGTGGWTGPKPGDPDLGNVVLRATPGFGGINVSWTLPNQHPYAVAYTIIYRATSSSFSAAVEIGRVAGNRYLDPMELHDNGLYYYWIRLVSIHGTEGELVGPAECRMHSTIGQIIDDLSGQIREGVLHQSLLEKIDRIQLLGDGLLGESKAREQDILAVTRLVDSLSLEVDNMSAAITTEIDLRISSIDSLARQLTTLSAEFNDTKGIIQQEIGVLVSEQEALARAVTVAQVTADNANAAFLTEQQARIDAVSALANQINTVESEMNGNLAQAKQTLETEIRTVDGKVTEIGARYTVQVNANGLAGGFGVYNDGKTIDAGFLVDRFWIGSTANNKKKPFIIDNGVVYIDNAMIQNASITDAKISNAGIDFAKIRNVSIDSAHIQDLSVETIKIANGAVGRGAYGSTSFWFDPGPYGGTVLLLFQAKPNINYAWGRAYYTPRGNVSCSFGEISCISTEYKYMFEDGMDGDANIVYRPGYQYGVGMACGWVSGGGKQVSFSGEGIAVVLCLQR